MTKEIEFEYCPKCSSALEQQLPNLLICNACGLHHYINPRITNAVILQKSTKEILLTIRKYNPCKGMLDLPGGFVDLNENLEEAAVRELHEELDIKLDVSELTYLGSCKDMYQYKDMEYYTVGMMYGARVPDDITPTAADDVESITWIKPEDIDYQKVAFDGMKGFMKSYFSSTT